jgi:hypothetical protein
MGADLLLAGASAVAALAALGLFMIVAPFVWSASTASGGG